MRIAIDIDDTLNIVDRVGKAGAYIAARKLPYKLKDPDADAFVEVYDWPFEEVVKFFREGGIVALTDAEARPYAREALASFRAAGHEVIILTARQKNLFVNPESLSRDWLEKRRIPYDSLVAEEREKAQYCAEHNIDILIDNSFNNCLATQERGMYAVLAVTKANLSRANEIAFGGANWKQIAAQVDYILQVGMLERAASRADATGAFYATMLSRADLNESIDACEKRAAAYGRPCRIRITRLDSVIDSLLESRGYPVVKTCAAYVLDKIPSHLRTVPMRVTNEPDGEWLRDYYALERASGYRDESIRFSAVRGERIFVSLQEGDRPVAVGFAVREGEDLGLYCLRVHPEFRRKGFGRAICERLLTEGRRMGAKRAFVQVRAANHPAIELYRVLGFTRVYEYWYREKNIPAN